MMYTREAMASRYVEVYERLTGSWLGLNEAMGQLLEGGTAS